MAVVACTALALLTGWSYFNRGLFLAARMLVVVGLAVVTGVAFGPALAGSLDIASRAFALAIPAMVAFVVLMIVTSQMIWAIEVDFHPALEQAGGGILGVVIGFLVGSFGALVLLGMDLPALKDAGLDQATSATVLTCNLVARVCPGDRAFDVPDIMGWRAEIESIDDTAPPIDDPAPPAEPEKTDDTPDDGDEP